MDKVQEKAELFIENLLTEGAVTPCDETIKSFVENEEIPPFYDEELFKRGQAFYHRNIFAVFSAKLYGLITVLSIPSILKILIHTKMSGNDVNAYKRYMATVFHMTIWYDSDFKPGSKSWQSILEVKNLHNSASKSSCRAGLHRISQKDMAITQFGFMGYQLVRSEMLGIYDATDEDWKGFIHLWRVIAHILGTEDRFNLCRGSVEETKAICEKLIEKVISKSIKKKDKDFLQMSRYLINGMWTFSPILNFNVSMFVLNKLLNKGSNFYDEEYKRLSFLEKCILYLMVFVSYTLRCTIFRCYHNHSKYRDLWLMKNFPFLAYYKFGYQNSHVKILGKYE